MRAVFVFIFIVAAVLATNGEQLPVKLYTTVEGLARDQVYRIIKDSRGFLWLCTPEGLSRFDGHLFVNYTTAQGLPSATVRDVLETRQGEYWIGTSDGLCHLNLKTNSTKDSICTVYKPEEKQARNIFHLFEDHTGAIWVGTEAGVFRLEVADGRVRFVFVDLNMPPASDNRFVEGIIEDRHGSLWVATRGSGLYRRLTNGTVEHFGIENGLAPRVNDVVEDRDGNIWVGTNAVGLVRLTSELDPKKSIVARTYTERDGLPSNWVIEVFPSSSGKLWIGTDRGLAELDPTNNADSALTSYTTANGLPAVAVFAINEDRENNVWIGTEKGAAEIAHNGFLTYDKADGLGKPVAGSILEDRAGDLYLFGDGILSRFNGTRFTNIRPKFPAHITGFSWISDQTALQDHLGDWWFATQQGLCRFPSVTKIDQLSDVDPKATYTVKDGLRGRAILTLFEDFTGDIWINSLVPDAYLTRWDRSTGKFLPMEPLGWPADTWVAGFREDRSGNLWLGTRGKGLVRYRADRFARFTTADGLSSDTLNALYVDTKGRLWIAFQDSGVDVVENPGQEQPRFRNYAMANGLSSNEVFAITGDLSGRIYISTGRGLDRLDPETGRIEHYTSADGLIRGEAAFAYRDRHGALWFGSNYAVSRLVADPTPPESAIPILIGGLRIAGNEQPLPILGTTELGDLTLEPTQNQVDIDFFCLMFRPSETLRYQYKLEGSDKDWRLPTDQRTVSYARLAPGRYRFLVRAVSADGQMSNVPASVRFTILPPIWLRWWSLSVATILMSAIIYSLHRVRVARILEVERVRMRIATDLHDDIGASLSRVALMSEVAKQSINTRPSDSETLLTDIADSARGVVESIRDIVWAIDPRQDDLGELVYRARQFASGVLDAKGIQWEFDTPDNLNNLKLDANERRDIYLFFKEAVHNAAKHSDCRSALLRIEVYEGHFVGIVRDDGKGLECKGDYFTNGYGLGLTSMERRARQHGGRLEIESRTGEGTQLKLVLPLKKRWNAITFSSMPQQKP